MDGLIYLLLSAYLPEEKLSGEHKKMNSIPSCKYVKIILTLFHHTLNCATHITLVVVLSGLII